MQPLNIDISQRAQGPASHIEVIDATDQTGLFFFFLQFGSWSNFQTVL